MYWPTQNEYRTFNEEIVLLWYFEGHDSLWLSIGEHWQGISKTCDGNLKSTTINLKAYSNLFSGIFNTIALT